MRELDLVVFDMAGTTVEDRGQVPAAFQAALAQHGLEVTPEQIAAIRGSSKREALRSLLPAGPDLAHRAEGVYRTFGVELHRRFVEHGVRGVPGAVGVFGRLRDAGVRVALTTGFDREITALVLDALEWADGLVDAVVCGDDVPRGRPAPYLIFRAMERTGATDVRAVANVGDTVHDLESGCRAGVRWNIGVWSGAHDRRTLAGVPHTHLLPSVADLLGVWDAD